MQTRKDGVMNPNLWEARDHFIPIQTTVLYVFLRQYTNKLGYQWTNLPVLVFLLHLTDSLLGVI